MAKEFTGTIKLDVRDSVPDWEPYLAPKAPKGAPNVLFIVLGRRRLRHDGRASAARSPPRRCSASPTGASIRQLPHHRPVLADAGLAPDRTQRDDERHGDDRRVRLGLPGHLDPHPVRERLHLRGAREPRLQHVLRRQVAPHPGRGVQRRRVQGALAARPRLRALLRLARRRDELVLPGPRPRQPPDRAAGDARRRATTSPTTCRTKAIEFIRDCQGHRPGQAVLHVLRAAGRPRPAPRARWSGPTGTGRLRRRLRGDPRRRSSPARRSSGLLPPRTPSCRRSTRTASPRAPAPNGEPWPMLDTVRPWESLSDDEKRLFVRMAEVFAGYISYYDDRPGPGHRLPRATRASSTTP